LPGKEKIDRTFPDPVGVKFKKFDDLYRVEEDAFNYQLSVLEKIRAPKSELRLIKRRDLHDFSQGHDGNYFIDF
jgi:uncharacterized lipoprotein